MSTVDTIRAIQSRHDLSQAVLCRYLGVPQGTLGNWLAPEGASYAKEPSRAVARLVEVLALVETLAPELHDAIVCAARE